MLAAAFALAAVALPAVRPTAAPAAPAAAAVAGVMVAPDGLGVRVAVVLDGPFHYLIDGRSSDRVVIVLDPVSAAAATHTLALGAVRSIRVRPLPGAPPRAEITVFTSEPVQAAGSFVEDRTLVVTLLPVRAPAAAVSQPSRLWAHGPEPERHAEGAVAPPGASSPAASSSSPDAGATSAAPPVARIAGRAVLDRAVTLDEGAGRLLEVEQLTRVAVSDPRIVGAVPVSGRELLLTARAAGRATVYVWDGRDRLLAYTVEVRPAEDPFRDLRQALAALLPSAAITVTEVRGARSEVSAPAAVPRAPAVPARTAVPTPGAPALPAGPALPAAPPLDPALAPAAAPDGRGVVLSGTVDTQLDRTKAEDVARAFVPVVVNLLTVRRPVQFSLHVEVVELDRSAQESLGITWGGGQQTPGSEPTLNGGVYNLQLLTSPGVSTNGLDLLIAQLEALSQRGKARMLARPGLVVLAGRTASLLLGGQVPVPVAGPNGTVTIEYKDFGVILTVRPEYQDDGRVFLQVAPEVSTLDFTDAIKVSGFTIPALQVRRAETMVAMRSGETLVVGGLLQHSDVELVQKVPLLGDLPVIGALFRSRSFQHQESDLVIFVTPQLLEAPQTVEPPHTP